MAYLQRQGSKWTIRFTFKGKKKRITVGESKKQANKTLKALEGKLLELELGLATDMNSGFSDFLQVKPKASYCLNAIIHKYFSRVQLAESTLRKYQQHCERFLSHFGSEADLRDLKIDSYVEMRTTQVSGNTIKKELITLRNLFKSAGLKEPIFPDLLIRRRESFGSLRDSSNGRCVLLSQKEVGELRQIVRSFGSELIADAVDVIAFTGMRRSELCRLNPEDIDLENSSLKITESKRVHGQITHRRLPIHPQILPLVKRRVVSSPLFTYSVHTLTSGLKKAIRGTKFDMKGFGFHALRHSAASRLLAEGVPVTAVASILGHATPQTTLQVYSHAFDEDVLKGIQKL